MGRNGSKIFRQVLLLEKAVRELQLDGNLLIPFPWKRRRGKGFLQIKLIPWHQGEGDLADIFLGNGGSGEFVVSPGPAPY
jgi:hypothetical protein